MDYYQSLRLLTYFLFFFLFRIAVIYKAGLFAMSTWVPLSCALMQILFNVSTSYLTAGVII